ncbi:nucleoside 2-deoxyribosyltransferase [candidate division KSB3 bacterium]|uniref:Nucleoside 2-deoxyribosyltransferase n=1 Tax=candidate division KSB3 bacterium TaxID=2044937 RepID=A0A9D5Q647_9BACT|nr:nucleoside 2-deoxyribosyltransferase [candidate division KSB3 bacterium]MBD3325033.1 nucleoside 2-deoxyribosyltransferase [candidate division KSB3 bacterium]
MMKYQPDFEQTRIALYCGQPSRVPLFELKVDLHVMQAFMGKTFTSMRDHVDFWAAAGYDYIRVRAVYDFFKKTAKPHEGAYSAYGNHTMNISWADTGQGMIRSEEDFDQFPWPTPQDIDYSPVEEAGKYLHDGMKIVSSTTGIFESVWMMMGYEGFALATIEQPDLIAQMFQKVGEIHYNIFNNTIELDHVGAMWMTDDIAYAGGLMVNPAIYRQYLFPWYKKMGALCQAHDIPYLYHSDGTLWNVLDDLIDCGFHALQPIEPKAMNIREVKRKVQGKLCLIGNVDVDLLARGTPEDVRRITKQLLRDVAPGGGYCLGSGNSVPNYVPVENYRAMVETVHEYGAYPIAL